MCIYIYIYIYIYENMKKNMCETLKGISYVYMSVMSYSCLHHMSVMHYACLYICRELYMSASFVCHARAMHKNICENMEESYL